MVIPDRDPRELLMTGQEIQISTVGRQSLAVVVKGVDFAIRLWDTSKAVAPSVVSIGVLVDVVTKMNDIVNGVLRL